MRIDCYRPVAARFDPYSKLPQSVFQSSDETVYELFDHNDVVYCFRKQGETLYLAKFSSHGTSYMTGDRAAKIHKALSDKYPAL